MQTHKHGMFLLSHCEKATAITITSYVPQITIVTTVLKTFLFELSFSLMNQFISLLF
jgi:hypothetical protein